MKRKQPIINGGYELGKTYFNSYWQSRCTVITIHEPYTAIPWSDWAVTVQWEDGHHTTHCTTRDKRDKEIKTEIAEYLDGENGHESAPIEMEE